MHSAVPAIAPRRDILVVEDEEDILELVQYNLSKSGFAVTAVTSGEDALKAVLASHPDLVLLDLLLPDVNGYSFIDLLRDHGDLDRVPIVIVSGCASPEAQSLGRELGARAYLVKPFTAQELIGCVNVVLGAAAKPGPR